MEITEFCREAVRRMGLGELKSQPQSVTGGFMHRMYRLETACGRYALKLLNPVIMERPDAQENYRRAEAIERILCENDIPVIPALEFGGAKMQCLDGQYFYLFAWSEGRALDWHEVREEHCRAAGRLLAKIHKIPCRKSDEQKMSGEESGGSNSGMDEGEVQDGEESLSVGESSGEDWDAYIEKAEAECPEIAGALAANRELLYLAGAPDIICISDGDMDCKNVLWVGGDPFVIDLESLDYGNPVLEMFQLALSWAGGAVCDIDLGLFGGFVEAYRSEYGELSADWEKISGSGYGWLDWLAYNTRRALGIECGDEEERRLGIREVHGSLRRIAYYHSVKRDVVEYLRRKG